MPDETPFEALQRAAEHGEAYAQVWLGYQLLNGLGLDGIVDEAGARAWFIKAAEQGDVEAQLALSGMLDQGLGGAKDKAEASHWLRMAAAQKYQEALQEASQWAAIEQEG